MLDWSEIVLRLGSAALIGAAIGMNRDLHHKPSGLRTLSLVSLGAASMVMIATMEPNDPTAVSRVLQGVMTGLGFLGAGVIVHEASSQKIHGLTTAAAVWVTACLGSACGIGAWRLVVVACGLVAIVLAAGGHLEKHLRRRFGKKLDHPPDDAS